MANCPPELYDLRYPPSWESTRLLALQATKGKCVLCDADAAEVHHAMYKDSLGVAIGSEVSGVHIFPLCKKHHKQVHGKRHWQYHPTDPLFGNRNTEEYLLKLRAHYLFKL